MISNINSFFSKLTCLFLVSFSCYCFADVISAPQLKAMWMSTGTANGTNDDDCHLNLNIKRGYHTNTIQTKFDTITADTLVTVLNDPELQNLQLDQAFDKALELKCVVIIGALELQRLSSNHGLELKGIFFTDAVLINRTDITGKLNLNNIFFEQKLEINRLTVSDSLRLDEITAPQGIYIDDSKVGSTVELISINTDVLQLRSIESAEKFVANGLAIANQLVLEDLKVKKFEANGIVANELRMLNLEATYGLQLRGHKVSTEIRISGVSSDQSLNMTGLVANQLVAADLNIFGDIKLIGSYIEDKVQFPRLKLLGDFVIVGTKTPRVIFKREHVSGKVKIIASKISS